MKPAHVLWQELNRNKWKCPICKFRSFNKAHYDRHLISSKHFLLTEFATQCPRDLKILIASFLPVYKIFRLPEWISRAALRIVWKRADQYRHCRRVVLPYLTLGPKAYSPIVGPLSHNDYSDDPVPYSGQSLAFEIRL